ncbi:MAG TPA: type II toxin-antitoxin system VapC family toxin [Nitrososphaerales archaeon]|nr:type II toxin-antitoxin system VapC family toxin [Nitrososphaerales archaeon]
MIYLDANFFLFSNFDQTSRGDNARKLQGRIISGEKAATCVLTLDEVMWVIIRNKRKEALRETIEDIYSMPNLAIKEVSPSTALDALDLMEEFDLRPRDAFHIAVMKSSGITEIASDDPDFDRVKGIKRWRF